MCTSPAASSSSISSRTNISEHEDADKGSEHAKSYSAVLFEPRVDHLHNPGHKKEEEQEEEEEEEEEDEEDLDYLDYDSDLDLDLAAASSSRYSSTAEQEKSAPSSSTQDQSAASSKHGRTWDCEARAKHSQRCKGTSRLTLSQKTDIIKLYYEPSSSKPPVDQKTLARMYGKSKAAISKILKPEYAHRVLSSYAKVVGAEEMNKIHQDRTKEQPGDADETRAGPAEEIP